ncbi:MAG: FtsX-like permease family protein, partial [Bacteroidota bacterium]
KLVSVSGHIQITKYGINSGHEAVPLSTQNDIYLNPQQVEGVRHIQGYSRKAALFYTGEEVGGVMLKGLHQNYDSTQILSNLTEGRYLQFDTTKRYGKEVILSQRLANRMQIGIGDKVKVMFVQDPPRYNRLEVVGLYDTGIEQFDDLIVFADNSLIQYLNNWGDTLVGGYEVVVDDFNELDSTFASLSKALPYDLWGSRVTDQYREFFDWFVMLERNVAVLMIVIMTVVLFNIIAVILILITERTEMIGTLKALGANHRQIQQIFFYRALRLIITGVVLGNVLGLGFCALQYYFELIPLDPANYYMTTVPIAWTWSHFLKVNLIIITLVLLVIFIPVQAVMRIKPSEAIRFD